jgi:hypothetical protein
MQQEFYADCLVLQCNDVGQDWRAALIVQAYSCAAQVVLNWL